MRWTLWLAVLTLAGADALSAQTLPHVEVQFSPSDEIAVGDHVEATITLSVPAEQLGEPRFPAWQKSWGDVEIVSAEPPQRDTTQRGVFHQRLILAPFSTGELRLPPQAIEVPLASGTLGIRTPDSLFLHVRSLLPLAKEKEKVQPRPGVPPLPLPLGSRFWWTAGIAAALCLGAGALVFLRRFENPLTVSTPALSPLAELFAALDRLESQAARSSAEATHTALSLALRHYLGRSLDVPATESTTSEIQSWLRQRGVLRDTAKSVVTLLRDCDQVKFARRFAEPTAVLERLAAARAAAQALEARQPAASVGMEARA